jgi:hypothetical protein
VRALVSVYKHVECRLSHSLWFRDSFRETSLPLSLTDFLHQLALLRTAVLHS